MGCTGGSTAGPLTPNCLRRIDATLVDYSPLEVEDVGRVIRYLKSLSGHADDRRSKESLALPGVENRGALWDHELDGGPSANRRGAPELDLNYLFAIESETRSERLQEQ
jgi:hypothetical protein